MKARRLYLLRHAKSSWGDPGLPDHDRPLAPRGARDAGRIAAYLVDHGIAPELVVCSSARRTRETLKPLEKALSESRRLIEDELYAASEERLLERLRRIPEAVASAMLIGHNPGLQELCLALAGGRGPGGQLRQRAEAKFPTAALATLALPDVGWSALALGDAELVGFVIPADLR